ncbi:SigE family RNA polymerase sigma factor [Streptacidiphilus rugosus]|uniref:SigE family RNA polymerase sigma factor n=1 Tax=Streptacidiphilus rugosus TaxID=405783 RepID=UPI00055E0C02|nr:SigE family RNA polymerase sigma factor [Streptacidiphilus rugosus]
MRPDEAEEFAAFVRARSAALYRTALLLTGSRDTADDLVQSTLERACRHWPRARRASSPEAYARRILVNLANDRRRVLRRRPEVPLTADRVDLDDPYGRLAQRDQLLRGLQALPVQMRTVLVLRYFDDLPDEGIAELMDVSPSTVRSQASRALAKLRAAVGRPETEEETGRARTH